MNQSRTASNGNGLWLTAGVMKSLLLVIFIGLSSLSLATSPVASDDEVVVIVPSDSSIDTLSKTGLRAIFGMRSRIWPEGDAIKVFVLEDDDPVHATFAKQVLHTFPFNLRRIWDRQVYSGTGQSPNVVKTEKEMRDKISGTENSIGYISHDKVDVGVKVVNLQ